MFYNKKILNLLLTTLFTLIIVYLIYKQIIYPTIIPVVKDGALILSRDWSTIVNASICDAKGYDVFVNNPCDPFGNRHVYGEILLKLPFVTSYPNFYYLIVPIIIGILFIYTVVSFFSFGNSNQYYWLSFFYILSTPFILALERINIDVLIFLFIVLIAKNKNTLLNHAMIVITSISKFYPICLSIVFFFKKDIKKIILNLSIILSIVFLILFFQQENLIKIFNNQKQFAGYGIYEFSFFGLLKSLQGFNIALIFLVLITLLFIIFFYKKDFFCNQKALQLFSLDVFENKLYILSSITIVLCYFSFSNYFYREIFFLGLIPWILKNEKKIIDNNFLSFYLYFLTFKFLISTILVFLSRNNIYPNFETLITGVKHSLDLILILIVTIIILIALSSLFAHLLKKN